MTCLPLSHWHNHSTCPVELFPARSMTVSFRCSILSPVRSLKLCEEAIKVELHRFGQILPTQRNFQIRGPVTQIEFDPPIPHFRGFCG